MSWRLLMPRYSPDAADSTPRRRSDGRFMRAMVSDGATCRPLYAQALKRLMPTRAPPPLCPSMRVVYYRRFFAAELLPRSRALPASPLSRKKTLILRHARDIAVCVRVQWL